MMTKTVYWISGLLAMLVIIFFAVRFLNSPNTPGPAGNTGQNSPYPLQNTSTISTNTQVVPPENTKKVSLQNGGTVATKDFLNDPQTKSDSINKDHYYLGNYRDPSDGSASSSPPYVIEYIEKTQFFSIALLQEPIAQSREQAEQYLIQRLGITQTQMCQLKYTVSVPYYVNQIYSSQSLGFSFCSGATQL